MKLHHSQKRIYKKNCIYFITTNTYNNHPYFEEDIFCRLFILQLKLSMNKKNFLTYAYKINPDHIHILIKTTGIFNYSQIIQFLKRNFSKNANKIIGFTQEGNKPKFLNNIRDNYLDLGFYDLKAENAHSPLSTISTTQLFKNHDKFVLHLKNDFYEKYGKNHPFPPFKWHKSFHFHIIENSEDFFKHLGYIKKQHIKHELRENKYCFIDKKLIRDLKFG